MYASAKVDGKLQRLHRVILEAVAGESIDHRNMNGLDCRRENLRKCSAGQNMMNRKVHSNTTSGFKGVSRRGSKWRAYINVNKKRSWLGNYDTAEDAAQAYDTACKILHGEFARPNSMC
jgi:AP2 domain-containing protein/HNH endonuclease